jgi:transcriptional regulator with XRE-family HTH domain
MLDDLSTMIEVGSSPALDVRIATRVRELRAGAGLSLEALARRSGVSRSMISLIERGESSATAVVLEKLSVALGVTLASLFELPQPQGAAPRAVARAAEQPPWRDPGSGYVRRNVSPTGWPSPIQIVDIDFPPGARVAYETAARTPPVQQQVWVLAGRIEVTAGDERHLLHEGDCLALQLDRPVAFRNPARKPARYAVVLCAPGAHA